MRLQRWAGAALIRTVVTGLSVALAGSAAGATPEAPSVSSLFCDNMVLQRDVPIPVWGRAPARMNVTVEFAGQARSVTAGSDGRWHVRLDPMAASSTAREMSIRLGAGGNAKTHIVRNVLVGEVWLCSGQSNMALQMTDVLDSAAEIAKANHPDIRMFRVPEAPGEEPWDNTRAEWKPCTPQTAPAYSATAYYFARLLQQELKVPVGIIVSAWGGSTAAAWMSRERLEGPDIRPHMPYDVIGWRVNVRPNKLYCAMLNPLVPFAIRGVTWYQGESDAEPSQNAYLYRYLLSAMISDWRRCWENPELPFYLVQLPALRTDDQWAILRDSQAFATHLPNVGMITTLDISEADNLHPRNKRDYGERLARLVLAREYGKQQDSESPVLKAHSIEGGSVTLHFKHASGGLRTQDGLAPKGFAIAGADRVFHPAEARIEGDSIVTLCKEVSTPVALRYAWSSNPEVNLVNANSLPVTPFRTDDWPLEGQQFLFHELTTKSSLAVTYGAAQITSGSAPGWRWTGSGVPPEELEKRTLKRAFDTTHVQFLVFDRPGQTNGLDSPGLAWTSDQPNAFGDASHTKGCTVDVRLQMYQASDPFRGFDIELALPQSSGQARRYRLSITPMCVCGFQGKETRILGHNLDNSSDYHTYRLAVRPDGVAQVYFDAQPLGVLSGEPDAKTTSAQLIVGKQIQSGDFVANLESVAWDLGGAYAPEQTPGLAEPSLLTSVEPANIFSDHMVLQRDKPVPVWGKAAPRERVRVCFDIQTKEDVTDAEGKWSVWLDPMPASATPREMTLQSADTTSTLAFKDVLVGDVWFCSGQSNMYMPVGPVDFATTGVKNSVEELGASSYPSIRLNSDPEHPLCGGGWKVCSPESVKGFSAAAYFFGRVLHQKLNVPVGLINRSRGGSPIQQWTPEAAAMTVPITRKYIDIFNENRDVIERYNLAVNAYVQALQAWQTDHKGAPPAAPPELPVDIMNGRLFGGTGGLYKRFVEPVVPYAIRGIIWYQGESNSQSQDVAEAYQELLTTLITSWRKAWGSDDIPFGFVQLPRWTPGTLWPWTRQSMLQSFLSVPGTGMVVLVDDNEPDNLHPTNKQLVGTRLASWALSEVYHIKTSWLGPVAAQARPDGNALIVEFRPGGNEPVAAGGRLDAFEVAGADGRFTPATAQLIGNTVRVFAASVPEPTQVRYGWSEVFVPSLFDATGIPASPFLLRAVKHPRKESH